MASKRLAKQDSDMEEHRSGCLGPHLWIVTLLLLAIAYASALLAAHTDGFKSYVQDRLEMIVGMPIRVERVRATPALSLILERVACAEGLIAGRPGLQVDKLKVSWRYGALFSREKSAVRRLELSDVYLSLSANEAGHWEPASVAEFADRLGSWLGVSIGNKSAAGELSQLFFRVPLTIKDGRIVWWDAQGEVARVEGVDIEFGPVMLGKREVYYRRAAAESVAVHGKPLVQGVEVEFIQLGDRMITL